MAITSTGYQAPATSREGLKPSVYDKIILIGADEINYTRAYNGGADVDPRLAGQGIFYAIEKDIAAQAYTPEIYAARLKQRGFSDESTQAFTQAYVQKNINIAKDYANGKAAEVYDEQIRKNLTREFEINAKNRVNINKDEAYRQPPMIRPDEPSIEQGDLKRDKLTVAREKLASEINVDKLNDEQKDVYDVFIGNKDKVTLQGKDLNDLYMLERGSRNAGVKKIMIKHAGIEKTGGLTNEELLGIMDVVRGGRIAEDSFEQFSDRIRYAYDLKENGVKFRVVIDEYNDGKKVFDYYSDRNFVDYKQDRRGLARTFDPHSRVQVPSATDEIISQKGNLVNEKEANGLRDSVSSVGDNASRADGRQASDEQVEQQWTAKADGQTNAAAAGEQVVEKQASGANIGGGLAANSNAHLGSGMVAGTLNSVDEDGNFSPERFAAGFLTGLAGGKAVATGLRKMTPKLYNQILGAAEKMPQMANGNPRLLGKLYSNGKDVSLNSFAGEKAITANVGKLDQAKAMLEKGADEVEIWQKTGWFKDKDGAWKFEIGDGNAKLNPGFQSGGRLGELLDHKGLFKAYPELKDVRVVKIGDETPDGAALSVKDAAQKEKRGIYNVTYNDKTATLVRQDLQKIDDALILEKGSNKKGGAVHIKKHLDPGAQGAITQGEFLSIGKNIREYLQKYKKPFIDESGGRIYEWADENGVKFRVVVYEKADGISASHPNSIISFYSNRNLKKPMEFRNPQVKYDVNLSEWHKDSAPITKNSDGSPKVFYHGTKVKQLEEFEDEFDKTGVGFWFSPDKETAKEYGRALLKVYIKAKNIMDFIEPTKKDMDVLKIIQDKMFWSQHVKLRDTNNETLFRVMADLKSNGVELKRLLRKYNYDGIKVNKDMFVVFDSTQVKHVKNDGNFSDSPNIYKSGKEGYYSPAKNEIGLRDLGDKSTLMHEVQHAIQEIEDFARGGDFNTVWSVAAKNIEKKYESELARLEKISNDAWEKHAPLQKEYIKLFDDGLKDTPEAQRLLKQMRAFGDEGSRADHEIRELRQAVNAEQNAITEEDLQEIYRKIHGEAEARNVQNRLNLDGKAHPHETFDVNPNETIVSKEGEVSYSRKIEEIKREHPNVEKELDESIAAMRKESFNDSNFKDGLISKFDTKEITTQELGKSVNLSDKQLAVLKNDIKNADFKVINESKIYFDKIGKDGDKKRFFVDIAQDGSLRVDAYAKSQIDNIPVKQSALEELAGTGDAARLKNMSFEVKAAYRNELDPIKKEAILKTAEYNALKKEMRGIYNTINNGKESTNIYKDLQKIESAIKLEQGSKKNGGAVHIQKHLDPSAKGAVTQQEVMSIGESVREYIKKYKEPFVDKDGGKNYEWQDKDGVRFRVAVYDKIKKSVGAGSTTRITTTDAYESIITFYSDRNLNGRMDFLDPRLRAETKFEEFKAKNLDENGNIKDRLSLC